MNYQILTLENREINLYKDGTTRSFKWDTKELIKHIDGNRKLYIIYLEKLMYYKNLFLYDLDKNNMDYEVVPKALIEINKYIYNYWVKESEEIIDVNRQHLFLIIDLQDTDLKISIFHIENTMNKLNIEMVYEDYLYLGNTEDKQYLFMDIISEIQRISRRSSLRNKTISKILLVGKKESYNWFVDLFKNKYSKELIDIFNYKPIEALGLYLDIKYKNILDPFIKEKISYFPKEVRLEEISEGIGIRGSIGVIKEYERLPIDKNITISPIGPIKGKDAFSIEVDNMVYNREISFPFTYYFDELKFRFIIEDEAVLKINVYINDSIIDTWNIDWRNENEI